MLGSCYLGRAWLADRAIGRPAMSIPAAMRGVSGEAVLSIARLGRRGNNGADSVAGVLVLLRRLVLLVLPKLAGSRTLAVRLASGPSGSAEVTAVLTSESSQLLAGVRGQLRLADALVFGRHS